MAFSIGELATHAGVKVPTIRYYEQIGLMPVPVRTSGKQRRYGLREVTRLNFIRHARELGFEINDIRELLAVSSDPERPCHDADKIVRRHVAAIEHRIAKLRALRAELQRIVQACDGERVAQCRVMEALADHGQCSHKQH